MDPLPSLSLVREMDRDIRKCSVLKFKIDRSIEREREHKFGKNFIWNFFIRKNENSNNARVNTLVESCANSSKKRDISSLSSFNRGVCFAICVAYYFRRFLLLVVAPIATRTLRTTAS